MLIPKKRPWHIPEREATPEDVYMNRRHFMKKAAASAAGGIALASFSGAAYAGIFDIFKGKKDDRLALIGVPPTPTSHLYPARKNSAYALDRPLTDEIEAAKYNNFYEFSSGKTGIRESAERMALRPWAIEITGLVERPGVYDVDELVRSIGIEERLYRLRCVEAWAMAVPWTGFPLRALIDKVGALSSARFIRFTTFYNKDWSFPQRVRFWLPWPYDEGLTMAEAANELAFMATGIYGHELPPQHGAPIRLVVPWKYGFKSIKSIVKIEFMEATPKTFWSTLVPDEYDFQANVNPEVAHPRWSQATERMIGTDERRKTIKYNGYANIVAGLYD